ncbi:3-deoxy-manno-octulosonate cytidylyltransferase [Nitratidesulfovibrio liaohensis]|uniref:3-deoxy-manno-octulosonate cytidylyltransferase n=1 Tax=Nitratidesulfovibrio liaohensis TaxID=2604158 RepID=A0ABY9QYY6_9BACT|nr:3-deoxy-manno-octulosonate cytidylyltransferase [Nitratidesulfovibrio liaohensis]WMW64751.1 3-deoxy-manno-octulosonate cytidylyltransferase [Nitratidesulfovibrio liaohensis]
MTAFPTCYGIIPARYASSRFPGKPLADIAGMPMFWHVYQRAARCPEFSKVVLATDDERIAEAAHRLDVPFVMTRPDHESGTDRVYEAACLLGRDLEPSGTAELPDDTVVVNIQGDEPALDPRMLSQLVAPFAAAGDGARVRVTTLAMPIDAAEAASPDRVKVVTATNGDALYFSRAAIPFARDGSAHEGEGSPAYLGHVGLYAFRLEALRAFTQLAPSSLERREKLEQLRLLENGIPIRVVPTAYRTHGVDRPEDIGIIINLLGENEG